MAVGDEQVLVAVQVHIQEGHAPGPIGGIQAGIVGNLGVGAVAAVELEGIAAGLLAVQGLAHLRRRGVGNPQLRHSQTMETTQHVVA